MLRRDRRLSIAERRQHDLRQLGPQLRCRSRPTLERHDHLAGATRSDSRALAVRRGPRVRPRPRFWSRARSQQHVRRRHEPRHWLDGVRSGLGDELLRLARQQLRRADARRYSRRDRGVRPSRARTVDVLQRLRRHRCERVVVCRQRERRSQHRLRPHGSEQRLGCELDTTGTPTTSTFAPAVLTIAAMSKCRRSSWARPRTTTSGSSTTRGSTGWFDWTATNPNVYRPAKFSFDATSDTHILVAGFWGNGSAEALPADRRRDRELLREHLGRVLRPPLADRARATSSTPTISRPARRTSATRTFRSPVAGPPRALAAA